MVRRSTNAVTFETTEQLELQSHVPIQIQTADGLQAVACLIFVCATSLSQAAIEVPLVTIFASTATCPLHESRRDGHDHSDGFAETIRSHEDNTSKQLDPFSY